MDEMKCGSVERDGSVRLQQCGREDKSTTHSRPSVVEMKRGTRSFTEVVTVGDALWHQAGGEGEPKQ